MNTETYITAICLIAAASIILISFRLAYWRNRAERAEAALAKIEATIAECSAETVKALAKEAAMSLAPLFRDQAVKVTMAKLRRPTANPSMETKATQFFDAVIAKQGDRK